MSEPGNTTLIRQRQCHRCKRVTQQEVMKRINANGSEAFGWWCFSCEFFPKWQPTTDGRQWVSKDELINAGADLEAIPVVDMVTSERCSVRGCGSRCAENHHWAPKEHFGDEAERWPQDPLCVAHHQEWHRRMRT